MSAPSKSSEIGMKDQKNFSLALKKLSGFTVSPSINPPVTIKSVNHYDEDQLMTNFGKLRVKVPEILHILPINKDLWFPDFDNKAYFHTSFRISEELEELLLKKRSPLLEDSLHFEFSKLFPQLKEIDLMNIVGYGAWNQKRLHYWIYQIMKWRASEYYKNKMRRLLEDQHFEGAFNRDRNELREKLQGSLNKRTKRLLEFCFGQADKLDMKCEYMKMKRNYHESLGYGNHETMINVVQRKINTLQPGTVRKQRYIQYLDTLPRPTHEIDENVLENNIRILQNDLRDGTFESFQNESATPLGNYETANFQDLEFAILRASMKRRRGVLYEVQAKRNKHNSSKIYFQRELEQTRTQNQLLKEVTLPNSELRAAEAIKTYEEKQASCYRALREAEEEQSDEERLLDEEIEKYKKLYAELATQKKD